MPSGAWHSPLEGATPCTYGFQVLDELPRELILALLLRTDDGLHDADEVVRVDAADLRREREAISEGLGLARLGSARPGGLADTHLQGPREDPGVVVRLEHDLQAASEEGPVEELLLQDRLQSESALGMAPEAQLYAAFGRRPVFGGGWGELRMRYIAPS